MIRFIITHTAYNGNPEGYYERRMQTIDAHVPELEAILRSGGKDWGDGTFERADVIGVEVRDAVQPAEPRRKPEICPQSMRVCERGCTDECAGLADTTNEGP